MVMNISTGQCAQPEREAAMTTATTSTSKIDLLFTAYFTKGANRRSVTFLAKGPPLHRLYNEAIWFEIDRHADVKAVQREGWHLSNSCVREANGETVSEI